MLVVEGEPDVGQLFETELSSDNFDVIVVPTGDEAVALASKRPTVSASHRALWQSPCAVPRFQAKPATPAS